MMLLHMVKKDILIIKKYVFIMLICAVLIPPFMFWRAPEYTGILGFMLSVIFCVLMLVQYVSLKEYQFPKAAALLCAAPFSRKTIVLSKYVFCMSIYVACCVIYGIEAVLFPELGSPDAEMFLLMFFMTSLFISVYLPVQYKLGYEKTKFVFIVVIMSSPVILPMFMKMNIINLDTLSTLPPLFVNIGTVLLSLAAFVVSVFLSIKFYDDTDLA